MDTLSKLYTLEGILCDTNDDGFSEKLKGRVVISNKASITEKQVALNLCARLGYESTAINLPVLFFDETLKDNDIFIKLEENRDLQDRAQIYLKNEYIVVKGYSKEALLYASEYLCSRFPFAWNFGNDNLELNQVVESISSTIEIERVLIKEIILNKNIQGIESIVIDIPTKDYLQTEEYIKNQKNKLCFEGIKKISFYLGAKKNKIEIVNDKHEISLNQGIKKNMVEKPITNTELKEINLSNLFSKEGLLVDTDNDFLPDYIDATIVIPDNADKFDILAASLVAAKLGVECLGFKYPLVIKESEYIQDINNPIFIGQTDKAKEGFVDNNETIIKLLKTDNGNQIIIYGTGQSFVDHVMKFVKEFPKIGSLNDFETNNLIEVLENISQGASFNGQLAHLDCKLNKFNQKEEVFDKDIECYFNQHDLSETSANRLKEYLESDYNVSNIKMDNYKKNEVVIDKKYDIPWEVDVFKDYLQKHVYSNIQKGDKVSLLGVLSEEIEVRKQLINDIEKEIQKRNGILEECNIFCGYKQGFSWITEYIIPKLKNREELDKIIIKFKPFLPEGVKEWHDEDGATPKLDAVRNDEGKWFDLPIRFLQELYPIDDVIAEELKINRDNVFFEIDENIDKTYEVLAYDYNHSLILDKGYSVSYSERPYLDEYSNIGKVHPNTGLLKVWINGELKVENNIKTDLENVWDIYQSDVLKSCKEYIHEVSDGNPTIEKQPFFNQLRLDIQLSEPDYKLSSRKDLISSLDALHEDIYFVGLDFIKTYGSREVGEIFDEPGLILPVIKKTNGMKPYMKFSLLKEKFKKPKYTINDEEFYISPIEQVDFQLHSIEFSSNKKDAIVFEVMSDSEEIISIFESYKKLLQNNIIEINNNINYNIILRIYVKNEFEKCIILDFDSSKEEYTYKIDNEHIDIDDIQIPVEEVIGYEQYIEIINKLKKVNGVKVWKLSESYQNRDIYAVDLHCRCDSDLISRTKMINNKPVYLINNRHHANEISSTNAAFKTIRALLKDKKYSEYLKKVNVTIIPFENVDGGSIHYMLQKDNPEWKLHIARFNSVGKEFAREYFNEDTKYGESLALPKAWKRWLPDIVVDNHGVPSHEWDQQFSGYTSPWFKGFWLPRALFYGYFWYVDSEEYPMHKGLNEKLQDAVADKINLDETISGWNIDWKDRFEKYAHKWMPKLFPANYYKDLIFYWIPYKPNKNAWHVSHRFPWITAIDWTTEVSDETAQGKYVDICSNAHFLSNIATIELLCNAKKTTIESCWSSDEETNIKKIRKRPLEF